MKLDLFRDTTFELANSYALILQAWAFFPNHYHLVVSFENTKITHRVLSEICTANWRCGSTALIALQAGE
jgi:hypothetical protein